ncbi:MAG: hypothetical protein WCI84_05080, partial [Bacteroidota bacterium]
MNQTLRQKIFIFFLVSIFMSDRKNLWGIHNGKILHHLTYLDIYKREKYYLKYGKKFHVSATPAIEETEFAYGLDLSRCIGCRRCVHA